MAGFLQALLALIDEYGLYAVLTLVGAVALGRLAYDQIRKRRRRRMAKCPEAPSGQPPIGAEYWDRPDKDLMADGHPIVAIWAVKTAMVNLGCELDYPPPAWSQNGWVHLDTSPTGE